MNIFKHINAYIHAEGVCSLLVLLFFAHTLVNRPVHLNRPAYLKTFSFCSTTELCLNE